MVSHGTPERASQDSGSEGAEGRKGAGRREGGRAGTHNEDQHNGHPQADLHDGNRRRTRRCTRDTLVSVRKRR
jgi:hypothetical protein